MIGFEQTVYTATEGVDSAVELCAIVVGSTVLERAVIVSFATRDGSATSIGGCGWTTNQSSIITDIALVFFICVVYVLILTIVPKKTHPSHGCP